MKEIERENENNHQWVSSLKRGTCSVSRTNMS